MNFSAILAPEGVDLRENFRQIHDVGHGEAGVNFFHVRAEEHAEEGFCRGLMAATGEDEEFGGAAGRG